MIPQVKINIEDQPALFDGYELSDKDLNYLLDLIEAGNGEEALNYFIEINILPVSAQYDNDLRKFLGLAESGVLSESDKNKLIRNVTILGTSFVTVMNSLYKNFVTNVYSQYMKNIAGLRNDELRKALLKEALGIFEESINKTIAQSSSFVVGNILSLQREMMTENYKIRKLKITGAGLDNELNLFKKNLRIIYPKAYQAIEEGKIIVSTGRHYKADYFFNMSTRTAILNYDRISNFSSAVANGERVIGYFQADNRLVKKDREICKEILSNKILGESILALDDEAANILGIMTVEEAENTPDYALGVLCRHSLRRKSKSYLNKIDKLIREGKNG